MYLWEVIFYIYKVQSLQCRQLPHPASLWSTSALPRLHTIPKACVSLPSHAYIPGFMQPGEMFNQENGCARKQHFFGFFFAFLGFFPPPQPIWFSARLFMGQAGPLCVVPAAGMCQEHVAGRGQSGTAHFGNTLSCSFCRGMILESQLDLFVLSRDDLCPLWLLAVWPSWF